MAWLPDGEKISKISLFVLAQLTNVSDGQTDGRTDGHRMRAIAALMHSIARQKPVVRGTAKTLELQWRYAPQKNDFGVYVLNRDL